MNKGLIHIYHGDGKGKTTAAMGLALRAAGNGWNVGIVQFLKGGPSGEIAPLEALPGVSILRGKPGTKFSFQMSEEEKAATRALHMAHLDEVIQNAQNGAYDLLVFDEALGACACGLLDEAALIHFLQNKPEALEVVLTGRGPSEALLQTADYVTEMVMRKHPFEQGVPARKGIEF